ncbi:hypothetical protein BDR26DRAFT_937229 [Obelidium mucronatum]|nr:hypothetical protein BDR26DRAFT_937229 [Obelidium mucronatum]
MKTRFTSLDCAAICADLQGLIGLRLANIYDANAKTFILKFAKPDHKALVLVESGIRVHPTSYARDKSATPSAFTAKLRKHLKTRRLAAVSQLGSDRIVDFVFGEGEFALHLFVELYSSGNIVLTAHDFSILAVLRVVEVETNALPTPTPADAEPREPPAATVEINFRVGQRYSMVDFVRPFAGVSRDALAAALAEYRDSVATASASDEVTANAETLEDSAPAQPAKSSKAIKTQKKKDKKAKQSAVATIKDVTLRKWAKEKFGFLYGPALVDHILYFSDSNDSCTPLVDASVKMSDILADTALESTIIEGLWKGFQDANSIMQRAFEGKHSFEGWITQIEHKTPNLPGSTTTSEPLITFDEFHPYNFSQLQHLNQQNPAPVHHSTFSKAVDEFFTHTESHRLSLRLHAAEANASKKLASVSQNHTAQVTRLQTATQSSQKNAACIEANLETVDAVITTVRQFVGSGMDWIELWELVKEEKRAGNYVASVIEGLKLENGVVTVLLMDPEFEEEEVEDSDDDSGDDSDSDDDAARKAVKGKKRAEKAKKRKEAEERRRKGMCKIDLDIYLSAWANARRYYDSKKLAAVKAEKTIHAVSKAMKQAEKKITQELKATKTAAPTIKTIRTPFWFEKYLWFVSSENYLIVAGRDTLQSDTLLRKFMRKDDVVVSADVEGTPTVLVINSYSAAFNNAEAKPPGVTAASPIPPLTLHQAGTMAVAHSKAWESKIITSAWWPPVQLIYGFGLLFAIDQATAARHYDERRPWARLGRPEVNDGTTVVDLDGDVDADGDAGDESESDEEGAAGDAEPPESVVNFEKYGLEKPETIEEVGSPEAIAVGSVASEEIAQQSSRDAGVVAETHPAVGKKRISAKERRELKKQVGKPDVSSSAYAERQNTQSLDESVSDESDTEEAVSLPLKREKQPAPSVTSKTSSAAVQSKAAPRGKKAKLKKMKEKYADQSDEEREVMMSLLHGDGSKKKAVVDEQQTKGGARQSTSHKNTGNPKSGKDSEKQAPKPPKQVKSAIGGGGDFVGDSAPAEDFNLSLLDLLTSQPNSDDIITAVVPVCAPWTCLAKYKYKVKLVPGSLKRGKAAKSVESAFKLMATKSEDKREGDVISQMVEAEITAAMLGKVKIMGAAGAASTDSKQSKKK